MNVRELSKEQLSELKEHYYFEKIEAEEDRFPSWYELSIIDELVSDEEVYDAYDYVSFVNDDFFCTAGQ